MLTGIKKLVAISAVFAVIGIGIHAATHDCQTHGKDSCVLCIVASSVVPIITVTVQPADPAISFTTVPAAEIPIKSIFYKTVLSRGPPVL